MYAASQLPGEGSTYVDVNQKHDDDCNSISFLFLASVEPPWERSVAGNKVPYYVE